LFGFNFFARTQSQALDHLERLGSRLIDHIRLDEETGEKEPAASVTSLTPREGRVKR
jgi:biopolymer transport protein ExbB